jgi:hypothetical protein
LTGLALIVVAGLLLAIPVPDSILPYWLGLCGSLAIADDVLIFRAIKIVDRFSD